MLSKLTLSEIQKCSHSEKDPKEKELKESIGAKKMISVNKELNISNEAVPRKKNRKKEVVAIEKSAKQTATKSDETVEESIKKPTTKDSKITVKRFEKALDDTIETDNIEVQSEVKSRRGKKIETVIVSAKSSSGMKEQSVVIEELEKKDAKPVRKRRGEAAIKAIEIISKTTDAIITPAKRGRKKAVTKETETREDFMKSATIQSEVPLKNVAQTGVNVDDTASVNTELSSETPRRGRRKLVQNVETKSGVTNITDLIVAELKVEESQIVVKVAQDPLTNELSSETPKRGRKKTIKNVETKSVVTKKTDLVLAELNQKEVTVDNSQMVENVAKHDPVTSETPRRKRKNTVKNVETGSVIINEKDLVETELKQKDVTVQKPQIIEGKVAEKELVSTDKLGSETPLKGRKKTVKNVASKKTDLVEVELQHEDVTEENPLIVEQVAEPKSATTNKLGRQTPLRGRKKAVTNVATKPVTSKKISKNETESEKKDATIEAEEKPDTVSRATKKRKSVPELKSSEMETSITTDLIPKRRLRGAAAKDVVETTQKKDDQVTTETETVETNSRKRKTKPATIEADIITIVKKSRANSSKKVIEELSAEETMEVQKILEEDMEPKPSRAKKVIVPIEVKRSTRRKN